MKDSGCVDDEGEVEVAGVRGGFVLIRDYMPDVSSVPFLAGLQLEPSSASSTPPLFLSRPAPCLSPTRLFLSCSKDDSPCPIDGCCARSRRSGTGGLRLRNPSLSPRPNRPHQHLWLYRAQRPLKLVRPQQDGQQAVRHGPEPVSHQPGLFHHHGPG